MSVANSYAVMNILSACWTLFAVLTEVYTYSQDIRNTVDFCVCVRACVRAGYEDKSKLNPKP